MTFEKSVAAHEGEIREQPGYIVSFNRGKENPITVSYKGISLAGITDFQVKANGEIVLTIKSDHIDCGIDFTSPPQNLYL